MTRSLMLLGTHSNAGKSLLATAFCRILARRGVRVAPFKAQNMSNNAGVTPAGGEMGEVEQKRDGPASLGRKAGPCYAHRMAYQPALERLTNFLIFFWPFQTILLDFMSSILRLV